jgi:hypothetical protein
VFVPPNVNSPLPDFVSENPPPNAPFSTTALSTVTTELFVNVPAPLNVNVPLLVAFPSVAAAPNEIPLAKVRAVVPSLETVPAPTVKTPVPNAPSLAK